MKTKILLTIIGTIMTQFMNSQIHISWRYQERTQIMISYLGEEEKIYVLTNQGKDEWIRIDSSTSALSSYTIINPHIGHSYRCIAGKDTSNSLSFSYKTQKEFVFTTHPIRLETIEKEYLGEDIPDKIFTIKSEYPIEQYTLYNNLQGDTLFSMISKQKEIHLVFPVLPNGEYTMGINKENISFTIKD